MLFIMMCGIITERCTICIAFDLRTLRVAANIGNNILTRRQIDLRTLCLSLINVVGNKRGMQIESRAVEVVDLRFKCSQWSETR